MFNRRQHNIHVARDQCLAKRLMFSANDRCLASDRYLARDRYLASDHDWEQRLRRATPIEHKGAGITAAMTFDLLEAQLQSGDNMSETLHG